MNHPLANACLLRIAALAASFAVAVMAVCVAGNATEIRMRAQCAIGSPVVTLGDVAEVLTSDAKLSGDLSATELFPTPATGEQKFTGVREIQDLLLLRGIRVTDLHFSGSNQTVISRSVPSKVRTTAAPANVKFTNRRVSDAIAQFLTESASSDQAWTVDVSLPDLQAKLLTDPTTTFTVRGGKAPWTGSQQFELTATTAQGTQTFPILANVHTMAPCVVATHNLPRGSVIREADVEVQRTSNAGSDLYFRTVEEVIGHETTRGVAAGKPVSSDDLRAPLAVRRGDIVTVYVSAGGIRVRTNARAKTEGSVGELIGLESMLDRSSFYARVSGIRQVEVFAQAPQATAAAARENAMMR